MNVNPYEPMIREAAEKMWSDQKQQSGSPASAGSALIEVCSELERAMAKFPTWPTDPLHALAVLGEEFGELTKEMLQLTYEPHKTNKAKVRTEAIQTAAMALRLVASIEAYEYKPGPQHSQQNGEAESGRSPIEGA